MTKYNLPEKMSAPEEIYAAVGDYGIALNGIKIQFDVKYIRADLIDQVRLTDWFPPEIYPAHEGWYSIWVADWPDDHKPIFDYWNRHDWQRFGYFRSTHWRGLTRRIEGL